MPTPPFRMAPLASPQEGADILASDQTPENMASYASIFAPPSTPQPAWAMQTAEANGDQAATALGAGPAISALMRAAEARRVGTEQDRAQQLSDLESPDELSRIDAETALENRQGDALSEGDARRKLLPYASDLANRDQANKMALAELQYVAGPQIHANADMESARINAAGREAAAATPKPSVDPMQALHDAMLARFKAGYSVDPKELAALEQALTAQPGVPGAGGR